MEKEPKIVIKEIVENILNKLSVNFEDVTVHEDSDNIRFAVKSDDSGILIGSEGKNIRALNYIIKQIVWRNDSEEVKNIKFFIDVNDYQSQNIERIKNKALETAEKAIMFKRDIEMDQMSSFERMIIHSALADNPKITTESSGDGAFRRIFIKYSGESEF